MSDKKQSIGSLFGMDRKKEQDGVGIQFGSTFKVLIARAGGANEDFKKAIEELTRPYRRMIVNDMLPSELENQIMHQAYARTIVRSWENCVDEGKDVPFSVDNCVAMFEKWPEFYDFVRAESNRTANYRAAAIEADAGN